MKSMIIPVIVFFLTAGVNAQSVSQRLSGAFEKFSSDSQLKHASISLYVIDATTGEVVFDKNSQLGMAPASTQKIFTAATAFELLGREFRYKTEFTISPGEKTLYVKPSGDPTLGSPRWSSTNEKAVLGRLRTALEKNGAGNIDKVQYDFSRWENPDVPDGWIWQDIGNYYGAAARPLNWRENQFDLFLKSGSRIGDTVEILGTEPELFMEKISHVTAAAKGTGDNAYIYFPLGATPARLLVKGTIPVNENRFSISGALPRPEEQFSEALGKPFRFSVGYSGDPDKIFKTIHTEYSPTLDSIVYWFLRKSVNLYGEALLKTFSLEKLGFGSADSGLVLLRKFWKEKGIGEEELNLYDGSGLSPLNRVTTHAQVEVLKYARGRDWFPYFYDALPEYNGMKMKSGTISDVKGFCGYQKSKKGKEYVFSFLINNYSGKTSAVINKMYRLLDELK